MNEFTSTVTEFIERSEGALTKTLGSIVVRPPIQTGERFKSVVLGQESYLVNVQQVVGTPDASVFIAESGKKDLEDRQFDIQIIAERIGRLANRPEIVMQMIDENPFPQP